MFFKKLNKEAKDENAREDLEEDLANPGGERVVLKMSIVGKVSKKTFQC